MEIEHDIPSPGYLGISPSEIATEWQAIIWAGDEDFYFYKLGKHLCLEVEDWHQSGGGFEPLKELLPSLSNDDISMSMFGDTHTLNYVT